MGKYFIEDYQSANGTKLNGVDIKGRGLHLLKTGDKIDVAGILVLIFRVLL
jgi:pSer/pThr/pTyr-binding forkhead associated (FHA) protein